MISVAVATPGRAGTPSAAQWRTTVALNPGETTKRAPAATARSTWPGSITVPAPTRSLPSSAHVA